MQLLTIGLLPNRPSGNEAFAYSVAGRWCGNAARLELDCMRTDERVIDDVLVLSIRERRVDARSAPALKERIASFVTAGSEWIVLDMSEVEFIDSSGLGAIMSALKLLGRKGDLVVAGAREPVISLFKLTRMDKVFLMFGTTDEARQALAART